MSFEPGIYFDLPESDYHADPAFSASGCKDMLVSPLTYWINSALNPDRNDNGSDPKDRGKAFHRRILEGRETFYQHYAILPDQADYPNALVSADDLKARCAELDLKKGGSKKDLAERIREADPDAEIWDDILSKWGKDNAGKTALPYQQVFEIERQAKIVEMQDAARKAFAGGCPEVSLFWIDPETGIRMKSRADYLKVRALVDLKTFTNPMSMPIDTAIARSVANYKYHIQASVYLDGIEHVKELYRQKGAACIHGNAPSKEWLNAFAQPGPHAFFFVFLEVGDVPNVRVREYRQTETYAQSGASTNLYWQAGQAGYRLAVERYKACMDTYGPDVPWVDAQPARPFTDDEMPQYLFA